MSRLEFRVGDWLQSEDPDPRISYTAAELALIVDDVPATRRFDTWSRTVTDRARFSLYPIAEWLAVNWWRLHAEAPYEPGGQAPVQWRLSHDLAAAGRGFVWPRVRFAFDNSTIQVSARAMHNALWEPIRYLSDIPPTSVPIEVFDNAVDALIDLVLLRLKDLDIPADPLAAIWADVLAERSEIEVSEWRRWEARLGYDAAEAPDELMERINTLIEMAGRDATAELAPILGHNVVTETDRLYALAAAPGIEAKFFDVSHDAANWSGSPPWEAGRQLARQIRSKIGRREGPLDNKDIADLLGIVSRALDKVNSSNSPVGLGVRRPMDRTTVLHFRKHNLPGIRFEGARFLADHLTAPESDAWLPLTDRATARQKFQRAFAAELLAPIDELRQRFGDVRTPDRFEEAGEYYGVSPLAIRSHLANHGLLAPEDVVV